MDSVLWRMDTFFNKWYCHLYTLFGTGEKVRDCKGQYTEDQQPVCAELCLSYNERGYVTEQLTVLQDDDGQQK